MPWVNRPSLRAANWLADDVRSLNQAAISEVLREAYSYRNQIVHGQQMSWEDKHSTFASFSSFDTLVDAAFCIVVEGLRKAIEIVLHTGIYESPWAAVTRELVPGSNALSTSRGWFEAHAIELGNTYEGQFAAVDIDRVLDSGKSFGALSRRISKQRGGEPILILQVDSPTLPTGAEWQES